MRNKKFTFRALAILVAWAMVFSIMPNVTLSFNTVQAEENYTEIGTEEELIAFRTRVNSVVAATDAARTESVILTDDIVLTEENWTPISNMTTVAYQYGGTFDGNGHSISGLSVNGTTVNQGLFGGTNGATIKGLKVSGSVNSSNNYVGGIIGKIQAATTLKNCEFSGSVTSTKSGAYVGGLVGCINTAGSSIENCKNSANITGGYAAGILGYSTKSNTISNCYNIGEISGTGRSAGIVGQLSAGSIENCFNVGKITGTASYIGGIYGFSNATVTNCYYTNPASVTLGGSATDGTHVEAMVDAKTLGSAYVDGTDNPVLSWENESPVAQVEKYQVSFSNIPEGATLTVLDADGKKISGKAGIYKLANGTYTYEVEKFGYKNNNGSFIVADKEVTVDLDDLEELKKYNLTIKVSPEDARIKVTHEILGEISSENGVYRLLAGEKYTYEISAHYYSGKTDEIILTDDDSVEIALTYKGKEWDGTSTYEPEKDGESYLISAADELAWFADYVKNTDATINAELTDDIDLAGYAFAAMGKYNSSSYMTEYLGTFNGAGYEIKGLANDTGLFNTIGSSGVVKNLKVSGTISSTGYNNIGLIAGTNSGTIENCIVEGTVSHTGTSAVGGICGRVQTGATVKNCVNRARVSSSSLSTYSGYVGGITAYSYGTIENCYNTGDISGNNSVGGIVGVAYSSAIIKNCYSVGDVSGNTSKSGAIAGSSYGTNQGTVTNCYYINTSTVSDTRGTSKTAEELKDSGFVSEVNGTSDAYNFDSENINNGYPVLKWQGGSEISDEDVASVIAARDAFEFTETEFKESGSIELKTLLEDDVNIAWTSDSELIDVEQGKVTIPDEGTLTVKLTAIFAKNYAKTTKTFEVKLWSVAALNQEYVDGIAKKINGYSVWAQEIIHPEETNVVDVIKRVLSEKDVDVDGINIEYVSASNKVMPALDEREYISDAGEITYFEGYNNSSSYKYVQYNDVKVKITKKDTEASTEVSLRFFISWDAEYVKEKLNEIAEAIKWDDIKGANVNQLADENPYEEEDFPIDAIEGYVSGVLELPVNVGTATVSWDVIKDDDYAKVRFTDEYKDSVRYTKCTLTGSPYEDSEMIIMGTLTFNLLNDGEDKYVADDAEYPYIFGGRGYAICVAKDENACVVDKEVTLENLTTKYEGLVTDFVTKEAINNKAVTDDIQMPIPSKLVSEEILLDRSNEKVEMISADSSVLNFYGYHGYVYRPLPGEEDKNVSYTIRITDRNNGKLIAEKEFEITVKALTEEEIDKASSIMSKISTDEIYWQGIAGENTSKEKIGSSLTPFVEITFDENGENVSYVRGAANITFAGIVLDDIPGYDAMSSQAWRTIRSSRESVLTSEQLLLTVPDYTSKLTLDSVMTYSKYAKYWEYALDAEKNATTDEEKAAAEELKSRYADFEQFYKQEVSVDLTVLGKDGESSEAAPETVTVTVTVDGLGFDSFENMEATEITFANDKDYFAWDFVAAAFKKYGYTYEGSGSYVSAIIDPNEVRLAEKDHGIYSGWTYTYNGEWSNYTFAQQLVNDGDAIDIAYFVWYTDEEKEEIEKQEQIALAQKAKEIRSSSITGLEVTKTEVSKVYLKWDAVEGATKYVVYRTTSLKEPYMIWGETKANTFVDTKANPNQKYYYTVSAVVMVDEITCYTTRAEAVNAKPGLAAVEKVKISVKNKKISWKKVGGATGYKVYKKTKNGKYKLVKVLKGAKKTSLKLKSVKKGDTYRIKAYKIYKGETYYGKSANKIVK